MVKFLELLFKHLWIFFIIGNMANAFLIKSKSKNLIIENPELEKGYDKIFKALITYGNIPWIIMGIGDISGLTNNISDFFKPRSMNPIVLLLHALIILFWCFSIWWIYIKDGAEFLEKHPGILQKKSFFAQEGNLTAKEIKIIFPLMLLGGIAGMIFMWTIDIPTFK